MCPIEQGTGKTGCWSVLSAWRASACGPHSKSVTSIAVMCGANAAVIFIQKTLMQLHIGGSSVFVASFMLLTVTIVAYNFSFLIAAWLAKPLPSWRLLLQLSLCAVLLYLSLVFGLASLFFLSAYVRATVEKCFALLAQAFVAVVVRRRSISLRQWAGLVALGTSIVFISAVNLATNRKHFKVNLAMIALSLIKPILISSRNFFEGTLMKDEKVEPVLICAVEGFWSFVLLGLSLPLIQWRWGRDVDAADGSFVAEVAHRWSLLVRSASGSVMLLLLLVLVVCSVNTRMSFVNQESALVKEVWRCSVPCLLWVLGLIAHALRPDKGIGDEFGPYDLLALPAFILLFVGIALYFSSQNDGMQPAAETSLHGNGDPDQTALLAVPETELSLSTSSGCDALHQRQRIGGS